MDKKYKIKSLEKTKEILKMTEKIVERYNVLNVELAASVATSLYENGIHVDKFQEKYYQGKFDLDQIVLYLLSKKVREEKTIDFQETISQKQEYQKHKNVPINYTEESKNKIVKYKLQLRKKSSLTDHRYYYEEIS